jgi:hypothetical protein
MDEPDYPPRDIVPVGGWPPQTALDRLEAHILLIMRLEVRNLGTKIEALEKATLAAQEFAKAAAERAAGIQEHFNESANEWRSTLTDFTSKVMPRMEIEQRLAATETRVTEFGMQTTRRGGTLEGISRMVPWAIAAIAVLVTAITVLRPMSPGAVVTTPPGLAVGK